MATASLTDSTFARRDTAPESVRFAMKMAIAMALTVVAGFSRVIVMR